MGRERRIDTGGGRGLMGETERETADLLIRHGYLITMDTERRVIADGAVAIRAILADPFIWDQPQGFAQGKTDAPEDCRACAAHGRVHQELKRAPKTKAEALARMGEELKRNAVPDALVTGHVAILGLGT